MKRVFTDDDLIQSIRKGGIDLEVAMRHFYEEGTYQQAFIHWLGKKGSQQEDAKDIFQDGLSHLMVNIREGKFQGKSSLKTYLFRICANLWNTKFKRSQKLAEIKSDLPLSEETAVSPEEMMLYKEQEILLSAVLSQIGKSCKKVLGLWSLSYSMNEIAQQMGYKSEGMARKKKYECFKKLMILLKDRPALMDQLNQFY
jgi:RNA polymerase sigma factor (sigma-70 family)